MYYIRQKKKKSTPNSDSAVLQRMEFFLKLLEVPQEERYIGWTFGDCPTCNSQLFALRIGKDDNPYLEFCSSCHYHRCYVGRPKTAYKWKGRARTEIDSYSRDRPLERDIKRLLRSLGMFAPGTSFYSEKNTEERPHK
jgi:hypothetical protein